MSFATKQKNPGRRYAQIVKLKPEFYDEYKKVHHAVWPEVLKQIKDCKIEDCGLPSSSASITSFSS
jgi:L-rhamnose mutarotase